MHHLYLHKVQAPGVCSAPSLLHLLLTTCESSTVKRYKTQTRILNGRREAAELLIEGLLQIARASSWNFVKPESPTIVLCLPTSSHGYASGPLAHLSKTAVSDVLKALESLALIERKPGHYVGDQYFQTQIWPTDRFLTEYGTLHQWAPRRISDADPIVLKNYDPSTKLKYTVSYSDTPETRRMRKNLRRINQAFLDSAIALAVDSFLLWWIRHLMSRSEYLCGLRKGSAMLSFDSVEMRRVFSRKSFKHGGRFYGGWWQSIPSRFRPYITINGQATVECDFANLHPMLMYTDAGKEPPEGDIYDLGYEFPDRTRARKIIKSTFNAMLNDSTGYYQVPREDQRIMGMTNSEIKQAIIKRHPILKDYIGTDRGLRFQNIDARIAERVMLTLLDQSIICLPVHDSFIVISEYEPNLRGAMMEAYASVLGSTARLKDIEPGRTSFEPVAYPSGAPNWEYMRAQERSSPYHVYLQGYYNSWSPQRRREEDKTVKCTKSSFHS